MGGPRTCCACAAVRAWSKRRLLSASRRCCWPGSGDDDAGDADLPPPPAPLAVAPTVDAPVGWASRRANTLEGGYGAHGWTTESAVGAQHASEHSTAHKAFADLYESAGPGSSGGKR